MYSVNVDNRNGLVAYYAFNGDNLSGDLETFCRISATCDDACGGYS